MCKMSYASVLKNNIARIPCIFGLVFDVCVWLIIYISLFYTLSISLEFCKLWQLSLINDKWNKVMICFSYENRNLFYTFITQGLLRINKISLFITFSHKIEMWLCLCISVVCFLNICDKNLKRSLRTHHFTMALLHKKDQGEQFLKTDLVTNLPLKKSISSYLALPTLRTYSKPVRIILWWFIIVYNIQIKSLWLMATLN